RYSYSFVACLAVYQVPGPGNSQGNIPTYPLRRFSELLIGTHTTKTAALGRSRRDLSIDASVDRRLHPPRCRASLGEGVCAIYLACCTGHSTIDHAFLSRRSSG
ncbi:unnamed protein product, partial [Laminaria digitata]